MTEGKIVVGVDIGTSKIVTIIARVDGELVNVLGVSEVPSRGVKKGQIVDIEQAVESIIASVEAAERMAGYNLDSAFIAIGGAHIHSQNSHGVVAVSDPNGEIIQNDVDRATEAASAISIPTSRSCRARSCRIIISWISMRPPG